MTNFEDELESIYRGNRQQLFTCALSITGSAAMAEDAVHDAFCNIIRRKALPCSMKAYVFGSVRNAAITARRQNRPHSDQSVRHIFDPSPYPPEQVHRLDEQSRLVQILDTLTEDQRETIVQHIYGGLTFMEIAEIRNVSPGTVASWYRRGINRLRTRLETSYAKE